jgi:hypothetical protein
VTKYVDLLERYWIDHKIEDRIKHLMHDAKSLPKRELRRRYDAVDRNITRGMLAAEKAVRHANNKYQWSKALDFRTFEATTTAAQALIRIAHMLALS